MRRENRCRIAEDQVCFSVDNPFLIFREIIEAQETWPLVYIVFSHIGQAAPDSSGIVLDADGKSPAGNFPFPYILQRFVGILQFLPGILLFREKFEAEVGET